MKIRDRIKELRRVPASELHPNPKNWRTHPAAQLDAIRGILAEVGFAGAELARELPDGSLELIDGHARAEIAGDAVIPVLVLDVTEAEADKILATFDPIGAMAEADAVKLDAILREVETGNEALANMLTALAEDNGIFDGLNDSTGEVKSNQYTNKIAAPIYDPKGEKPMIVDLSDKTKTNELCDEIEKAKLPEDVRGFLLTAAQRHTVFNFRNIAEFYCHASADVQHLMERSGLIIIDMDKAIANGFVHLSERLGSIADLELSEVEDA